MPSFYRLIRPLLFAIDAERVHHAALHAGRLLGAIPAVRGLLSSHMCVHDPRLRVDCMGLTFSSPLGIAAGFDKNAQLLDLLPALGFGFLEVGTTTARAWQGNPRPRLFRLAEDQAIVNRMGLNNEGARIVATRVRSVAPRVPVGINIGRVNDRPNGNAIQDYVDVMRLVQDASAYVAINVSCPNTGDGRTFEEPEALGQLLGHLRAEASLPRVPWLLKLSPDLPVVASLRLVDVAVEHGVAGFILTNTTVARQDLRTRPRQLARVGRGGLSGRPLRDRSQAMLLSVYRHLRGARPLIGVGGISDAADAYARIRAGASLLQVYTGLIYEGPTLVRNILLGLLDRLERDGVHRLQDVVGVDA